MPSLCNGNGKAGIRAVKAAQSGIHAFCGLNGFEGKTKLRRYAKIKKACSMRACLFDDAELNYEQPMELPQFKHL